MATVNRHVAHIRSLAHTRIVRVHSFAVDGARATRPRERAHPILSLPGPVHEGEDRPCTVRDAWCVVFLGGNHEGVGTRMSRSILCFHVWSSASWVPFEPASQPNRTAKERA